MATEGMLALLVALRDLGRVCASQALLNYAAALALVADGGDARAIRRELFRCAAGVAADLETWSLEMSAVHDLPKDVHGGSAALVDHYAAVLRLISTEIARLNAGPAGRLRLAPAGPGGGSAREGASS